MTRLEAKQPGLQAHETELQYSAQADLVLVVPPGVAVTDITFDFFRTTNVVEFKGPGQPGREAANKLKS